LSSIETPRLLLHPLTREQAELVLAGETPAGLPFAEGYPLPDTADGVRLFLRHGTEGFGSYLVVRREDGVVIGEIGFHGPPTDGAATIGYGIVPGARRQGYATEAIVGLSDWALAQPGIVEVRAEVERDNMASTRALLGAGFAEVESDGPRLRYRKFRPSSSV
jgi:ribosomal-protein-alanine N-acetyltransferase